MLLLWQAISAKTLQHPPASTQRPIRQRLLRAIRLHRLLAISENGSWALLPRSGTHLARCAVDKANPGYAHWRWTTYGPSVIHSGRALFSIAPPVCCLDIVWMIVSPSSSHAFGILMVWHDVVVIREFLVTDGTFLYWATIFRSSGIFRRLYSNALSSHKLRTLCVNV
jgi:hypothetical protein